MATTTNFGWETPDDTDLVKDGAAAMRTLGNAIDTSLVDLKGGTTGQVLSKASNTDMDFSWVTSDDANAIQNTIVDAKGDLISATAADTPARLAVGSDYGFLSALASESTGLKWVTTWTDYTPTLTQSGTVTRTIDWARYIRIGKTIIGQAQLNITGTGTASNRITLSVPVTAKNANTFSSIGTAELYDASSFNCYPCLVTLTDVNTMALPISNAVTTNGNQYLGVSQFTAALANGDQLGIVFAYEAA